MALRIGIVGFGRIGRSIFRLGYNLPGLEIAAICDSAEPESLVYLLNNSSIEGRFEPQAKLVSNHLVCGSQKARMLLESDPGHIPWDVLGVDIVIECTNKHRTNAEMEKHIAAGAKLVILSTPSVDELIPTVVMGINENTITGREHIISAGSSSVHALALMLKVLEEAAGIEYATMTTIHAYTGDQTLSDTARGGLRWSRSAAQNIIPNVTWAPAVVSALFPALAGKIQGLALNVPVAAGSNIDLVAKLKKPMTKDDLNAAFCAAADGALKNLLAYTDEPIVSSDAIGNPASVIYDSTATIVIADSMTKTLGWFDNGWAYASRLIETAQKYADRAGKEG